MFLVAMSEGGISARKGFNLSVCGDENVILASLSPITIIYDDRTDFKLSRDDALKLFSSDRKSCPVTNVRFQLEIPGIETDFIETFIGFDLATGDLMINFQNLWSLQRTGI